MRRVLAAILFALMGAALLLVFFALQNLWDDYKDSPDSLYIETAAIEAAIAIACGVGGALVLRRR